MKIADKFTVVKAIAGFQKAWTSISFKKFGGLYFTKDLDKGSRKESLYTNANGVDVTDSKFAIN